MRPNELVKSIHDRMPVILPKDKEERWLNEIPIEEAIELLKPYETKDIKAYAISTLVNSPTNNILEILTPV